MATGSNKTPDFFKDDGLDPVETATGYPQSPQEAKTGTAPAAAGKTGAPGSTTAKKKAGFYLPVDLLNRFNLKFHELKLAGVAIDNKSTLLEAALGFALDDMDRGDESRVLKKLGEDGREPGG
jgi:hypothetical protein